MKFGEVFDYRTAEEAKKYLGKKGAFSDNLKGITERPSHSFVSTLKRVGEENSCPFYGDGICCFQFFRPVLEGEERMTNRQLSEWLAKGNGEYSYETNSLTFNYWQYSKGDEDKPVGDYFLIRRWRDTEWVKPTKDIYEEDCMPDTIINKEACK